MGNLQVRGSATNPVRLPGPEFEPERIMREMLRWDPFQPMSAWIPKAELQGFYPDFEVKETDNAYLFRADVPGVKENDVDVTLTGNRLTVTGKREQEKEDKTDSWYVYERSYGSFSRSFTLPEQIDTSHVRAELKDGVMTIAIPKSAEAKPRKIEIKAEKTQA